MEVSFPEMGRLRIYSSSSSLWWPEACGRCVRFSGHSPSGKERRFGLESAGTADMQVLNITCVGWAIALQAGVDRLQREGRELFPVVWQ